MLSEKAITDYCVRSIIIIPQWERTDVCSSLPTRGTQEVGNLGYTQGGDLADWEEDRWEGVQCTL